MNEFFDETLSISSSSVTGLGELAAGTKVSGTFSGSIMSQDTVGDVNVKLDSLEISTENRADKSLRELMGKPKESMAEDESEDDDY